jgi:hypothetical protein
MSEAFSKELNHWISQYEAGCRHFHYYKSERYRIIHASAIADKKMMATDRIIKEGKICFNIINKTARPRTICQISKISNKIVKWNSEILKKRYGDSFNEIDESEIRVQKLAEARYNERNNELCFDFDFVVITNGVEQIFSNLETQNGNTINGQSILTFDGILEEEKGRRIEFGEIREMLNKHFSEAEIIGICMDIFGMDDDIRRENKNMMVIEFLSKLRRTNKIDELLNNREFQNKIEEIT